jgi:hypothetical protein
VLCHEIRVRVALETWLWPRDWPRRAVVLVAAGALLAYIGVTFVVRLGAMFDPWSADGDQAQAVWHYWRYHKAGAIPPGDLLTDYAFVMHAPPVWWALMASLSSIFEPVTSAKILNTLAYWLTPLLAFVVVARRSHFLVGIAAAFLLARSLDFHGIIAGGYARSFGPLLVYLFLWTFLERRHLATLAVLVFQAAFYPSVVMPCGIAYGVYVVAAGPMRARLFRTGTMFVAGLLIIALGKVQDLRAPDWWGPIVTEAEALEMPAWGPGGRINEAPLKPISFELERNLTRAFHPSGAALVNAAAKSFRRHTAWWCGGFLLLVSSAIAFFHVRSWRARIEGAEVDRHTPLPFELLLVGVAAFVAYLLARALAFKLYLPYRTLQHTFPYLIYVGAPLLTWCALSRALPRRPWLAAALTCGAWVLLACTLWGHGVERGPKTYQSFAGGRPFYLFIRDLPNDAVFAGDFSHVATIPLFGAHQVYVNKNLAHPFRQGYYAECERRILRMYQALYATSLDEVAAFGREENVRYFMFHTRSFATPDVRLFMPPKRELDALFHKNKKVGFALADVPKEAVVWRSRSADRYIVDLQKLDRLRAHAAPEPGGAP